MTTVKTYAMPEIGVEQWNEIQKALSRLKPVLPVPLNSEGRMLDDRGNVIPWSKLPRTPPIVNPANGPALGG